MTAAAVAAPLALKAVSVDAERDPAAQIGGNLLPSTSLETPTSIDLPGIVDDNRDGRGNIAPAAPTAESTTTAPADPDTTRAPTSAAPTTAAPTTGTTVPPTTAAPTTTVTTEATTSSSTDTTTATSSSTTETSTSSSSSTSSTSTSTTVPETTVPETTPTVP